MSRIQQVLRKAEEEGTVRRTRGVPDAEGRVATPVLIAPDDPLPLRVEIVEPPVHPRVAPVVKRTEPGARPHPLLVSATSPHSPAAERYRSLRTRIAQAENGATRRVLMMTSPGRGEGKSITSVNLSITMAQEFHRRVIVVDADLRRPSVHSLLGLPLSPGLSDVLLGGASLEDVLVTIPDYRLTVIPAGLPPEQPTELLGSTAMRHLLEQLRSQFDRIVLDIPPVEPLADAGVLIRLVDGVILIVRAGKTSKPSIERALGELDSAKLLGLVLNDAGGPEISAYGFGVDGYSYGNETRPPEADKKAPRRSRQR